MICYLLSKLTIGLCFTFMICSSVKTHTDTGRHSQEFVYETRNSSLENPHKRETEVKTTTAPADNNGTTGLNISNVSDAKRGSNSRTRNHSKPSVAEDNFNSTVGSPEWMTSIKSGALERTGFVALGFMSILLLFFAVRAIRVRQKKSKSRKYGIITSTVSDMEMEPLDRDDEDEEDTTLFDAQHKYTLK